MRALHTILALAAIACLTAGCASSANNPLPAEIAEGPNLLSNGDFSRETEFWNITPGVLAEPETPFLVLASENAETFELTQDPIALEGNMLYRARFAAQSEQKRELHLSIETENGVADLAEGAGIFALSSEDAEYSFEFISPAEDEGPAVFRLRFAGGSGQVRIGRIGLHAVSPVTQDRRGRDPQSWTPHPVAIHIPQNALEERGARLPFATYEAEVMNFQGKRIGPSRQYTEIAAEASGRQGIDLAREGDFIEFTLKEPANSILVRFSIPDAGGGKGTKMPLSLSVDGKHRGDITLSSEFVIVYGDFPWTNDPGDGSPRHFFDEASMLTETIPAGARIRLQRPASATASYCIIDLVDTELVAPPAAMPEGFLSITDFGAVADDGKPDNAAIEKAIKAAKTNGKQGVWFPAGHFNLSEELYPDIVFRGAGMWHTVLDVQDTAFRAINRRFEVRDLSIAGTTKYRNDSIPSAGFEGNAATGSVIENVWIRHTKVGIWTDRGTDGLIVRSCRIRDLMADGVNLYRGTRNSLVENSHFRGTGDDAIALWSATVASNTEPSSGNIIRNNTVQSPWLANGIAVYGGRDTTIERNIVYDTVLNGAGIDVSSAFDPVPFSGYLKIVDNTLIRCGSYNGDGGERQTSFEKDFRGALWIDLAGKDLNADFTISGLRIFDATLNGITIEGPGSVSEARLENILIDGAGAWGIRILETAQGSISLKDVAVRNALSGGLRNRSDLAVNYGQGQTGL